MTNLFLIPGYRYCGPGNELKGQDPRNSLDNYCRIHDEAYGRFKKTPYLEFVDPDRDLIRTIQREYTRANMKGNLRGTKGGKYSTGETLTAKFVQGVFQAKEFLAPHNLSMSRGTPSKRQFEAELDYRGEVRSIRSKSDHGFRRSIEVESVSSGLSSEGQMNSTNTYSQCSAAARGHGAPLGVATDVALRTKPTIKWGAENYSAVALSKPKKQTQHYSVKEPFRFNMHTSQAKRNLTFFSVRHTAVSKPESYDPDDSGDYPNLNAYKPLLPGYNSISAEDYPIKNCGFDTNVAGDPISSQTWDTLSQLNLCELENASYNLMTNRKITQDPVTLDMHEMTPEEVYKEDYSRTYPYVSMETRNYNSSAPQFINTDNKQFGLDDPCPTEDKIITNIGRGSVKFTIYNSSDVPAVVTIVKYQNGAVKVPMMINGWDDAVDSPGPARNIVKQLLARKKSSLEQFSANLKFNSSGRDDEAEDIFFRPKTRALPENVKFKANQSVVPYDAATDVPAHNGLVAITAERLDSIPFKEVDRIAMTIPAGERQTAISQLPPLSYDSAKDMNRSPYIANMAVGTSSSANAQFFIPGLLPGIIPIVGDIVDDVIDDIINDPGGTNPDPPSSSPTTDPPGYQSGVGDVSYGNILNPSVVAPGNATSSMGGGWSSQHGFTFAILVNGMPIMSEAGTANVGAGKICDIQEAPTEIYVEGVYSETVLPSYKRHDVERVASTNSGLYDIPGVAPVRIMPMSQAVRSTTSSHLPFAGGTS